MTASHDLEQRLHSLGDIRGIMRSMKVLSLLESRKLARFLESQQRVVDSLEQVAADFGDHFSLRPPDRALSCRVLLVLGAERGFCGDFNETLMHAMAREAEATDALAVRVIAVGSKLGNLMEREPRTVARLNGPVVAEEVAATLNRVVDTLTEQQARHGPFTLTALHHDMNRPDVRVREVLPPFEHLQRRWPKRAYPPRLQLPPETFRTELTDHYLFAVLNEIFYTSLMAESHRRVQHLDGALDRLDRQAAELSRRRNQLRQEEITEEIELILLNLPDLERRRAVTQNHE